MPASVLTCSDTTTPNRYWLHTRRPLANLVFVLPWLLLYELGCWWTESGAAIAMRNGADAWMRQWLSSQGIVSGWLPLLVLGALFLWHWCTDESWTVRADTLMGMLAESLLFAFLLILSGQLVDMLVRQGVVLSVGSETVAWHVPGWQQRLVSFLGAGIYEEFLFRLCLIPLTYLVFRLLLVPHHWAMAVAIVVTSVVFALAHYLVPQDGVTGLSLFTEAASRLQSRSELWFGFAFRLLAGLYFGVLFCTRGFGVTVGCHALYDIVVGVVLVSEL
jgi:hypothetical protein